MCYSSPGPRCADHVGEEKRALEKEYNVARRKLRAIMKAMWNLENAASTKEEAHAAREYKDLTREKDEVETKIDALYDDIQEKKAQLDATAEGIADLEDELQRHHENKVPEISVSWGIVRRRLAAAKENYNGQMLAYDTEHGTVDGREPSPYGDDAGVARIEGLTLKYKKKYEKATKTLKKFYHKGDYDAYQICLDHAVKTRDYVQRGIVDSLIASRDSNDRAVGKYTKKLKRLDAQRQELTDAYVAGRQASMIIESEYATGQIDEEKFRQEFMTKISEFENSSQENLKKIISISKAQAKVVHKLEESQENLKLGNQACEALKIEDDFWR